jgi:hypothetical protein
LTCADELNTDATSASKTTATTGRFKRAHGQESRTVSQVKHAALEFANLCWSERRQIVSWMGSLDLSRTWGHWSAAHRDDDAIVSLLRSNEAGL